MTDEELSRVQTLVGRRLGFHFRLQDRERLRRAVLDQAMARGLVPSDYARFLTSLSPDAEDAWEHLGASLAVHETYFFRDRGQINLVRDRILPELIRQNSSTRRLRLWSAGCSTGEEVYTLAILISDALEDLSGWDVRVVGTDLSDAAVRQARSGLYESWSFRLVEPGFQERYFTRTEAGWRITASLRALTTFHTGNLVRDPLPDPARELAELDLIICRNVLIYLERHYLPQLAEKFFAALRPGGVLITGHSELPADARSDFLVRVHPDSVIFQRPGPETMFGAARAASSPHLRARVRESVSLGQSASPPRSRSAQPLDIGANNHSFAPRRGQAADGASVEPRIPHHGAPQRPLLQQGDHPAAPDTLASRPFPVSQPNWGTATAIAAPRADRTAPGPVPAAAAAPDADDWYRRARDCANIGQYGEAEALCRQAVQVNPEMPLVYCLLAELAEERGDLEAARSELRRAIYVDPRFAAGYLRLSGLYEKGADFARARKMTAVARQLLQEMPDDAPVEPYEAGTAGEFLRQLDSAGGWAGSDGPLPTEKLEPQRSAIQPRRPGTS